MSTVVENAADAAMVDLTLEDALDSRADALAYLNINEPKIVAARKALRDLETVIALRLEESGARKFERGGYRGSFVKKKSGSASVHEARALRVLLEENPDVPKSTLDDALPWVTPEPDVKPDLRKLRKLAEFGKKVAAIIRAHIVEPNEYEVLVIEPVQLDVTGTAADAIGGAS